MLPEFVSSAKGKTNYELREQFHLPEGASQSMAGFKSRPVATTSRPTASGSQAGSGTTGSSCCSSSTASGPAHKVGLIGDTHFPLIPFYIN